MIRLNFSILINYFSIISSSFFEIFIDLSEVNWYSHFGIGVQNRKTSENNPNSITELSKFSLSSSRAALNFLIASLEMSIVNSGLSNGGVKRASKKKPNLKSRATLINEMQMTGGGEVRNSFDL